MAYCYCSYNADSGDLVPGSATEPQPGGRRNVGGKRGSTGQHSENDLLQRLGARSGTWLPISLKAGNKIIRSVKPNIPCCSVRVQRVEPDRDHPAFATTANASFNGDRLRNFCLLLNCHLL